MSSKHTILVANRGEIAMRIVQACHSMGLGFVCVHTEADRYSGHVALAEKLGGPGSVFRISSYQDANEILSVADNANATAVHPGYGFFSEDYRFARRVTGRKRKLIYIGPSWRVIRDLGDKINTKRVARGLGLPTIPGSDRPIYDELEAEGIASSLFAFQKEQGEKLPMVLVKASAGGGGMGIEEVYDMDMFRQVYRRVRNYAGRQFNDEGVLIEQRLHDFNHIEVQIVCDRKGQNPVHFGTRNCSVQSSGRQKRIEVAPGFVPAELPYAFDAQKLLGEITEYSMTMARSVGYDNVGTWEWIVSRSGRPFLMEVNSRIQVENGVSGLISRVRGKGPVDIVSEQIRIGLGEDLGYTQDDVIQEGVGIEYRLLAEDPANRFAPWVGLIEEFDWPEEPWLQVHTQVSRGIPYEIPTEFDPNLALALVWGEDLSQARTRGLEFLNKLVLKGRNKDGDPLKSNVDFLVTKTEHLLEF